MYSSRTISFDDDRALVDCEASLNQEQKASFSSIRLSILCGLRPPPNSVDMRFSSGPSWTERSSLLPLRGGI